MYARWFNMFHYPHHMKIFTIKNGVDLCFLAPVKKMIDQNFISWNVFQQTDYSFFNFVIVDDDAHPLSTQYIARTHKNRITHSMCNLYGFIHIESRSIIGIRTVSYTHLRAHETGRNL